MVRESAQRVGHLIALDVCSLGIEPPVEADAADAGGERTELIGSGWTGGGADSLAR
jgi:hypothetical protein